MMKDELMLEFTGERFTPECEREIWYEHYHRYAFAKNLVTNKKVLDIASGEGYGSCVLAKYAQSVVAMDIDESSINHAQNKYQKGNLKFIKASCLAIPLDDNSIDVIVSFETLEHLAEQKEMLQEFNRVLKTDGLLIISTPDKKHYSDATGFTNEFHVKELYKNEFEVLLKQYWQAQKWFAQDIAFYSVMENLDPNKKHYYTSDILNKDKFIKNDSLIQPMYYVVIAAKQADYLPNLPDLHLFADSLQSIYGHYNAVIRAHIKYEKKYYKLKKQQEYLLSIPIIGKLFKYFDRKNTNK